jgi:hypothetical protein
MFILFFYYCSHACCCCAFNKNGIWIGTLLRKKATLLRHMARKNITVCTVPTIKIFILHEYPFGFQVKFKRKIKNSNMDYSVVVHYINLKSKTWFSIDSNSSNLEEF